MRPLLLCVVSLLAAAVMAESAAAADDRLDHSNQVPAQSAILSSSSPREIRAAVPGTARSISSVRRPGYCLKVHA